MISAIDMKLFSIQLIEANLNAIFFSLQKRELFATDPRCWPQKSWSIPSFRP